mmetsp:Transcript_7980/g.15822  ORF Transcript_7980/g.15822 Transcript_7980/m.15822 type:complete len:104 (-) Transcript_7980:198-509(-)
MSDEAVVHLDRLSSSLLLELLLRDLHELTDAADISALAPLNNPSAGDRLEIAAASHSPTELWSSLSSSSSSSSTSRPSSSSKSARDADADEDLSVPESRVLEP